jgi:hypothetical protein
VTLPARSKKNAPYRKAKGNGMRAGWIGCPRKLALLLMLQALGLPSFF